VPAKWIYSTFGPIKPIVLKIFGENLRESVVFRIRPHVGVKPIQLIGCAPVYGLAENRFIRIENGEFG
jgi:hypothetical protein